MYDYSAKVLDVIDGDTIDVQIDLGLRIYHETRIRLADINAPELHATDPKERAAAVKAKEWLTSQVLGKTVRISTQKDHTEKYGRYLGVIWLNWGPQDASNPSINDQMVTLGLAVPYSGGPR